MPSASQQAAIKRVADVMTTLVHAVTLDDSIRSAKQLFDRHHFHHLVVLERQRVVGVVSDRDILKIISPFVGNRFMERNQDRSTLNKRIHQIMTRNLVTIGPDESLPSAGFKMLNERVSCLPVVDEHRKLLGILTIRDCCAANTSE